MSYDNDNDGGVPSHVAKLIARNTVHGLSKLHPAEYQTWKRMRGRCLNPNSHYWHRYGGRGIGFCQTWNSFDQFMRDMGERPSKKHSLDRINNDGNYSASNCRWASQAEQSGNRAVCIYVVIHDQSICLKEACRLVGISYGTVRSRMRRLNLFAEDALYGRFTRRKPGIQPRT